MSHCQDCGTKTYSSLCPNCDEETFIADQYRELGESVPPSIREIEIEQRRRREPR